jgi:hypothetical protein
VAILQPPSPLEPQDRKEGAEYNQHEAVLIAPRPSELRHVPEIHSVDTRHEGRRDSHDGNDRQHRENVVLLSVDETQHRVQQELYFVGQVGFVVGQAFGRLGGLKGGAKGGQVTASRRTPEERRAAVRHAVKARWEKYRAAIAKSAASKSKATRKKT